MDDLVEVADVAGDGERLIAGAALEGFENGEGIGEGAGDWSD
jgi:hypothetical protein